MKIIFSRKGFDSSSGGVPSPIFPDGRMLSLPIPDKSSDIAYREIAGNKWANVGELVAQLAERKQIQRAHLDPDLESHSLRRIRGWKPIFGQANSAESHLANNGVGAGDVFLFFGLFRNVEKVGSRWSYIRACRPRHVIFGWLQIDRKVAVAEWPEADRWALYHPHFSKERRVKNVVYVADKFLKLPGQRAGNIPGAGTFPFFSPQLQLTAPDSPTSRWLLPAWCHPKDRKSVLSYHGKLSRWEINKEGALLSTVGRGQEFVLDCDDYPEAINWLRVLVSGNIVGKQARGKAE